MALVAVPVVYVAWRAAGVGLDAAMDWLLRARTAELLFNTVILAATVVIASIAVALPLAWLVRRTDLPGRKWVTVLAIMPLAVPGYVMAYALRGLGGPLGAGEALLGVTLPRVDGFVGAALALTLYNAPYVFLTFCTAFDRLDPAESEAARSLGAGPLTVLWRVHLPRFVPAALAGSMVVGLYVLGDFGVVSLMRFDTLSLALFTSWSDLEYGALLALTLIALTAVVLAVEAIIAARVRGGQTNLGAARRPRPIRLGRWSLPIWLGITALGAVGLIVPVVTTVWWATTGPEMFAWADLGEAVVDSLSAGVPAALLTVVLAVPVAWLARRGTRLARLAERVAQVGYAVPSLALALGFVVFAIHFAPSLRDTLAIVWLAYAAHFLMLAMGPLRGTLPLLSRRHEEAARSLGCGPVSVFARVILPALRGAMAAGLALSLLAMLKELPLAKLLAPLGSRSLAVNAWGFADEALFADAAPYALTLLAISALSVVIVLRAGRDAS